jgi:transposase
MQTGREVVPLNLAEWIDEALLREWITEAVESLDWSDPRVVAILRDHPAYRPKVMLVLLTYAYATTVFEAEEILRRCESNEVFQQISQGRPPGSGTAISRFRRENRGLLKWSLVQVFKRAIRHRTGEVLFPPRLKRQLADAAVMRLNVARQMDSGAEGL